MAIFSPLLKIEDRHVAKKAQPVILYALYLQKGKKNGPKYFFCFSNDFL